MSAHDDNLLTAFLALLVFALAALMLWLGRDK